MGTIEERLAELKAARADLDSRISALEAESGKIIEFIKTVYPDGLPKNLTFEDVADIVAKWEAFQTGKP